MKNYKLLIICATVFCLLISGLAMSGCGKNEPKPEVKYRSAEEIGPFTVLPYSEPVKGITSYTDSKVVYYTDGASAGEAGVPEGFEGSVVATYGTDYASATFDFSELEISVASIAELTILANACDNARKITVSGEEDSELGTLVVHKAERNHWAEYTFTSISLRPEESEETATADGTETEDTATYIDFSELANEDGCLGCVCVYFQYVGNLDGTCYIDGISYKLKEEVDTVPPVLTYNGPTEFSLTAGKKFEVEGTAFDAYENREFGTFIDWKETCGLDENGLMLEGGPYNIALAAADNTGNITEIPLVLTVRPRDTEAPVININTEEMTVAAGTYFNTYYTATDNEDEVEVSVKLTKNAMDYAGRINAGDWEMTLSAEDLTGNRTEKVIIIHAE